MNNQITQEEFNKLSVTELKAMAFDELHNLEMAKNNLRVIDARIIELLQQKKDKKDK